MQLLSAVSITAAQSLLGVMLNWAHSFRETDSKFHRASLQLAFDVVDAGVHFASASD